jgi:hypothetical protein
MLTRKIIPNWSEHNIYLNLFFLITIIFFPLRFILTYVFRLTQLIKDLNLYDLGYYDKYIN